MPEPQTEVLIEQLRRANRRWKMLALGTLAALLLAVVGVVAIANVQASRARAAAVEAREEARRQAEQAREQADRERRRP
jgi:hypothetical protein